MIFLSCNLIYGLDMMIIQTKVVENPSKTNEIIIFVLHYIYTMSYINH